ncbi:DUF2164 domain-containing protein [Marinobacterium aestuariivivens]|uniref:DUF2164 domain-containing protein n=1 Tax=Marinobacterium aestuariivivens TaxID=1698799 RepID=A0ABW2A580_9GAMM
MADIKFSSEQKAAVVARIRRYFQEELEQEIGQFDAEFLLDFFAGEIGGCFYNRGLEDAQTVLQARLDSIAEAIGELEKPVDL